MEEKEELEKLFRWAEEAEKSGDDYLAAILYDQYDRELEKYVSKGCK